MTDPTMALRALLEKSSDTELLPEMVGLTVQRLMDLEAESLTGAPCGKRSEDRVNQRNAYLGNPRRHNRAACAQTALRQLLSRFSWSLAGWPRRRSLL